MIKGFSDYMGAMHSLFNFEFMAAFRKLEPKVQRRVLPYLQSIYRRWYYATFIENIHFSPTNLAATVGYYCNEPPNTHIVAGAAPSAAKMEHVDMKVIHYSIESHPVVTDLKRLVKACSPHVDLCEEWCFSDAQAMKLAKKLSLCDPYYASFLLEIACKMGILTRMPSLYVQRAQVSQEAEAILGVSNGELLHQIVETAIRMASVGLQGAIHAPIPLFTEEGIRHLLLNPISTDEILDKAFSTLGYDLDLLPTAGVFADFDEFSEESDAAAELMSGIFVVGIMLDRLFFTPFGYFLRLIRPIYAMPMNIETEINNFVLALDLADDEFVAFFAPCTSYSLSELGLDLFRATPAPHVYFDSRTIISKDVVENAFVSGGGIQLFVYAARESIPVSELPNAVYTFCVYNVESPDVWFHIQIPKAFTLHHLYEEIIDFHYMEEGDAYSFFHGRTENPFVEYIGGHGGERGRKPGTKGGPKATDKLTNIPLMHLDFDHVGEMLLVVELPGSTPVRGKMPPDSEAFLHASDSFQGGLISGGKQKAQKYMVEWLGEAAPDAQTHYPQISKVSDAAQKMLDALEDGDDFINFDGFDF